MALAHADLNPVSILARTKARALRHARPQRRFLILFQSSPAPRRGRYLRDSDGTGYRNPVSILARTKARALLKALRCALGLTQFQSSPAPRRGRYLCSNRHPNRCGMVSILARTKARALQRFRELPSTNIKVSILARTKARALQFPWNSSEWQAWFQSSPAPRRGRYAELMHGAGQSQQVSILARTKARALRHEMRAVIRATIVSILARTQARALLS